MGQKLAQQRWRCHRTATAALDDASRRITHGRVGPESSDMTAPQPPRIHRVARGDSSPALTIDELLEENKQLRALVVQLCEIVVRNVLHQNPAGVASAADRKVGPP